MIFGILILRFILSETQIASTWEKKPGKTGRIYSLVPWFEFRHFKALRSMLIKLALIRVFTKYFRFNRREVLSIYLFGICFCQYTAQVWHWSDQWRWHAELHTQEIQHGSGRQNYGSRGAWYSEEIWPGEILCFHLENYQTEHQSANLHIQNIQVSLAPHKG